MDFDVEQERIFLSNEERQALGLPELFGGVHIEGLRRLEARAAGYLAVNAIEPRNFSDTVLLFAQRRDNNVLQQIQAEARQIRYGQVFEEPPIVYDALD